MPAKIEVKKKSTRFVLCRYVWMKCKWILIESWFWVSSLEAVALYLLEAACVIAWQAGGREAFHDWKLEGKTLGRMAGLHSSSSGTSCCWSKQRDQHSHTSNTDVIFSITVCALRWNARTLEECCVVCARRSLSNGEVADGFTHHKMWSAKEICDGHLNR